MSDSNKIDARLSRVYDNPGDKQALFDDWAPTYDHDLVNEMGYVADAEACRRLEALVPDPNVGDSVEVPPPAPEPEPEIVVKEIPEAPQGELYIKENDDNNSWRRRRPRPEPHRRR